MAASIASSLRAATHAGTIRTARPVPLATIRAVVVRGYDALVLDIDGTLLDEAECIHPRTRQALARARACGVTVMLATGRSHGSAREIARELELDTPAIVFNGAGLYCSVSD